MTRATTKPIGQLSADELRDFLLRCDWASPQFIKLTTFNKLDGEGLLALTKKDLRDTYGIVELGTVKAYLRNIQNLDEAQRTERLELDTLEFSILEGRDRLQTATPTFSRYSSTPSPAATPRSTPSFEGGYLNGRPVVGGDHRRPHSSASAATPTSMDEPVGPPRPLTANFLTEAPPTVASVEDYLRYRETSPLRGDVAATAGLEKVRSKARVVEPEPEDQRSATRRFEEAQKQREAFMAGLGERLAEGFQKFDRDNRGYVRHDKLDPLLRQLFPSFSPKMVQEYKAIVIDDCDPDTVGKVQMPDFILCLSNQLASVEAAFRMVDKNNTGSIDYLELEALLKLVFPTYSHKERKKYHNAIVMECDKSGEGTIDLSEFVMSQYANMLSGPAELEIKKQRREARLEELFSTVDKDRSGIISHEELRQLIENVFPDFSVREKETFYNVIVAECDKDGSGSIEFKEFIASDYANTMLEATETEDDLPKAQRKRRDRTMDRDAWASKKRGPAEDKDTFRMTAMGSTSTTEEYVDKNSAEAAKRRRESREASAAAQKEATMSDARRKSTAHIKMLEEEERAAQMAEAREVMRKDARRQQVGYVPGILEKERRYAFITSIFEKWDESSDISKSGSGFIEYGELRSVLQRFYNWTDAEADANADATMRTMDKDMSGTLDFHEFVQFIDTVTKSVTPKQFDFLMKFLWSAIADFSTDQEHDRRVTLLQELFVSWDYDESGMIDQKELFRVLTRFNDMERDGGEEEFVTLMFSGADEDGDGVLTREEFVAFFDDLTYKFVPDEFDMMVYRLHRCLEEVQILLDSNHASLKYKQVLLNALEGYEIEELLRGSTPFTPLICYGTACDPSRAIEQYAEARRQPVKAFLVTHDKGEKTALEGLRKYGIRLGYWVYFVLGKEYPVDHFLRTVGIALQTSGSMNPRFRLWMHAPYPYVKDFPNIILCNSHLESLDEIDPEDSNYNREELETKLSVQAGRRIDDRSAG